MEIIAFTAGSTTLPGTHAIATRQKEIRGE
jgi:hypothetical protein